MLTAQWCQKETKVTSAEQDPGHGLADARRHRKEQRHADQDRTLLAMQHLEAALGSAAPHREEAWLTEVRRTLGVLSEAARDEADNAAQPDSLLSDIARTQPWLRNRARGLSVSLWPDPRRDSRVAERTRQRGGPQGGLHRRPATADMGTDRTAAPASSRIRPDIRGLLRRFPL